MKGLVGGYVFGVIAGVAVDALVAPFSQTDKLVWLLMWMWIGERTEYWSKERAQKSYEVMKHAMRDVVARASWKVAGRK